MNAKLSDMYIWLCAKLCIIVMFASIVCVHSCLCSVYTGSYVHYLCVTGQ